MVNRSAPPARGTRPAERRERARGASADNGGTSALGALGTTKPHPFGDLHTLQHLSVRLARGLRRGFEAMLRTEARCWAEPLEVQRVADLRMAHTDRLTAWLPLSIDTRPALLVVDGAFALELLDLFFGGPGQAPATLPSEFSPAVDALLARVGAMVAAATQAAWEPLDPVHVTCGRPDVNAPLAAFEAEELVVVTRFGLARGEAAPAFLDLVYPVATLKPHTAALTGKVVAQPAEPDADWQMALTRAAMNVRIPVRSVLAEPVVSLARLLAFQPGDIIPISFGADVPVMIGGDRVGTGTVGTSNGHAAIRITKLEGPNR